MSRIGVLASAGGLIALLLVTPASADSINACVKLTNNKIKKLTLNSVPTCNPSTENPVSWSNDASPLVAFARFDGVSNTVESFGGSGTTGAALFNLAPGAKAIQFYGTYPAGIATSKVSALGTSATVGGNVSVQVNGASPTQITVVVETRDIALNGVDGVNYVEILVAP